MPRPCRSTTRQGDGRSRHDVPYPDADRPGRHLLQQRCTPRAEVARFERAECLRHPGAHPRAHAGHHPCRPVRGEGGMTDGRRAIALVSVSVALLAGCTVGPDFARPDKPKADGYTPESLAPQTASAAGDGGAAQAFIQGKDIPGQWWTLFHSAELN